MSETITTKQMRELASLLSTTMSEQVEEDAERALLFAADEIERLQKLPYDAEKALLHQEVAKLSGREADLLAEMAAAKKDRASTMLANVKWQDEVRIAYESRNEAQERANTSRRELEEIKAERDRLLAADADRRDPSNNDSIDSERP